MTAAQETLELPGLTARQSLGEAPGSAVYVDAWEWPYGRMMMCHMLAERVEDLHTMADRIGVARRWFQNGRYPHYDICKSKRAMAVKLGAQEIDRRQFVEIARRLMQSNARLTDRVR